MVFIHCLLPMLRFTAEKFYNIIREFFIMNGQSRKDISAGVTVDIILKADQRTGKLTRGVVKDILTNSQIHPRGIKVRLVDGQIGRVQGIIK